MTVSMSRCTNISTNLKIFRCRNADTLTVLQSDLQNHVVTCSQTFFFNPQSRRFEKVANIFGSMREKKIIESV